MKQYWIKCAQVRSMDPLIVRTRTGTKVTVALDQDVPEPYCGEGDVHFVVDAGSGSAAVPKLDPKADDFSPNFTQFVFQGQATAYVEGPYLVVESEGELRVTYGKELLPFDEAKLAAADRIDIGMIDGEPPPHQPL